MIARKKKINSRDKSGQNSFYNDKNNQLFTSLRTLIKKQSSVEQPSTDGLAPIVINECGCEVKKDYKIRVLGEPYTSGDSYLMH